MLSIYSSISFANNLVTFYQVFFPFLIWKPIWFESNICKSTWRSLMVARNAWEIWTLWRGKHFSNLYTKTIWKINPFVIESRKLNVQHSCRSQMLDALVLVDANSNTHTQIKISKNSVFLFALSLQIRIQLAVCQCHKITHT